MNYLGVERLFVHGSGLDCRHLEVCTPGRAVRDLYREHHLVHGWIVFNLDLVRQTQVPVLQPIGDYFILCVDSEKSHRRGSSTLTLDGRRSTNIWQNCCG